MQQIKPIKNYINTLPSVRRLREELLELKKLYKLLSKVLFNRNIKVIFTK